MRNNVYIELLTLRSSTSLGHPHDQVLLAPFISSCHVISPCNLVPCFTISPVSMKNIIQARHKQIQRAVKLFSMIAALFRILFSFVLLFNLLHAIDTFEIVFTARVRLSTFTHYPLPRSTFIRSPTYLPHGFWTLLLNTPSLLCRLVFSSHLSTRVTQNREQYHLLSFRAPDDTLAIK